MPWTDLLLLALVLRGYFAYADDLSRAWHALRRADDEITSVIDFQERQRVLRSETFPRSIP